jgi:hypothetical protein
MTSIKKSIDWQNHFFNFLAVILGVYLAFYLNEKAIAHLEKKEAQQYANLLISDLESDLDTYITYQIPVNQAILKQLDTVISALYNNDIETFESHLGNILEVENYAPTDLTYSIMKTTGKLTLLNDMELQKNISDFYEVFVKECEAKNELQASYFTDTILKWLTQNTQFQTMTLTNTDTLNTFVNQLLIYHSFISQKTKQYQLVVEGGTSLKAKLEQRIQR